MIRRGVPTAALAIALHAATAFAQAPSPDGVAGRDTTQGIRFLYLVRHGWYDASTARDRHAGDLDALGRMQSRLTGERLARLPVRPAALVSSTLARAEQTAAIIGRALHMRAQRDSDLCECSPPSYRPDYVRVDRRAERDSCLAQLERAWARYARPAGSREDVIDVLVCHGNVIRWLTSKALHLDLARWPDYDIANGSITVIQVRPDGSTRVAAFSDTGHIPANLQTWTGRGAGWSPPPPVTPPVRGGRRRQDAPGVPAAAH